MGGAYTTRDHRGDPNARPPMKPIDVAKQREAIGLLKEEIHSAKAFQFKLRGDPRSNRENTQGIVAGE